MVRKVRTGEGGRERVTLLVCSYLCVVYVSILVLPCCPSAGASWSSYRATPIKARISCSSGHQHAVYLIFDANTSLPLDRQTIANSC